jgi:hypothetical protein
MTILTLRRLTLLAAFTVMAGGQASGQDRKGPEAHYQGFGQNSLYGTPNGSMFNHRELLQSVGNIPHVDAKDQSCAAARSVRRHAPYQRPRPKPAALDKS